METPDLSRNADGALTFSNGQISRKKQTGSECQW